MSKFKAFHDDDSSDCSSRCCQSEQSSLKKGTCEVDITPEESFDFSLENGSSLCEEFSDMGLTTTTRSPSVAATSRTGPPEGVGSTVFQDFLLCFDERELLRQQQALLTGPSLASFKNQGNLQHRQLQRLNCKAAQTLTRALSVRRKDNSNTSGSSTVITLPQFLWQSEGGLCCHSERGNDHDDKFKIDEELILFEVDEDLSAADDDDYLDDSDEDSDVRDDGLSLNDNEPLLQPGSRLSSFASDGGTLEDPRYVPRPSSTTPGLREMSKFCRHMLNADDILSKNKNDKPGPSTTPNPVTTSNNQRDEARHEQNLPAAAVANTTTAEKSAVKNTVKNISNNPSLSRFLQQHRRSRSELKTTTSSVFSEGALLSIKHKRNASDDGCNKKGRSSSTLMNFLRRTRLPSFRKSQVDENPSSRAHNTSPDEYPTNVCGETAAEDVADILASLDEALKQQDTVKEQDSSLKKQQGFFHQAQSSKIPVSSPGTSSDPPSTLASGDTHSDGSSLFGGIDSDDESFSEEDDDDCDSFFATPHYSNQDRWRKDLEYRSIFGQNRRPFTALQGDNLKFGKDYFDTSSMVSSRTELTRCSSVDTAKASNLSSDPGADRARLLEIQAYLLQQQQEREKRLNAPPIEFEAGDNVIHVREANCETIDAACEIEVLPKREVQQSQGRGMGTHADSSITRRLPPTAAEF